ncbi:MAG TPA: DsrE/DsrF/DrsH-like family protein [Candidatus Limnocylindrales bacterium]
MTATLSPQPAPTATLPPPDPTADPRADAPHTRPTQEGVTIVVFSGDFDRVQAAFNIAIGAASSGMPVTMFFTFWGLDVITRPDARRLGRDPLRTAFRWLKPGGARRLPLSRFNFLGLGPVLMRRLMGEFKMPTVDEMLELARSLGVKIVACTITMGVMGLGESDLIEGVDSFAGVATYLNDARSRSVNLFI